MTHSSLKQGRRNVKNVGGEAFLIDLICPLIGTMSTYLPKFGGDQYPRPYMFRRPCEEKNGFRSLFHILKEFRQKIEANALATRSHCNAQWKFQWIYNFEIWYFVTKIVLTYCEKKLF